MKYLVILFITLLCLTSLKAQILTQEEKERIILALNDNSLNVRSAALEAIVEYQILEAEDSLKSKIWRDNRSIQIEYLQALLALNSSATEEYALSYLDTLDAISLGKPEFTSFVLDLKVRATKILFELQNYSTVGYVFDLIQQDKPDVNIWAIDLLPQIIRYVPSYAELAKNELIYASINATSEIDRLNSMVNLIFLFGDEELPLLLSACENDESPAIRSSIIAQFLPNEPIVNATLRIRLYQEEESAIRSQIIDFLLYRFGTASDFKYVSDYIIQETDSLVKRLTINSLNNYIPPPPDSTISIESVIDSLSSSLVQCFNFEWVSDLLFKEDLQSILQSAKTNLQSGDSLACRVQVKSFQDSVDNVYADSLNTDPRFVTLEGWKFLYWNAQYILDRLPEIPSTEGISTYSVFAAHGVWLEQNSEILSGNIGVNEISQPPFMDSGVELSVGISTETPAGYTIKANRIKVKQNATVNADVYYNEIDNNGTITGTLNTPLELPLFTTLPEFHTSTPGIENIVVPQNGEYTLTPGAYNEIQVKKNGRLIFTGGEYHINKLTAGDDNQILFQSESEVRIKDKFDSGQGSYIGPEDTTIVSADEIVFYVEGINGNNGNLGATPKAAKIGISNKVKANFYVPNGTLWLRQNSEVEGAFIGKDVDVGIGVKVKLSSAF